MAKVRNTGKPRSPGPASNEWHAMLDAAAPIVGVSGPGRWLVIEYAPTSLFSLKTSLATSSVGKTLVLPTPYSIKMAYVDAGFRVGLSDDDVAELLRSLVDVEVRIAPPPVAIVTHTFIKVRQESRKGDPLRPYDSTIAYREFVHLAGSWRWAFDLSAGDERLMERLVEIAPYVSYIGKRGSFVQYRGLSRQADLDASFTKRLDRAQPWQPPVRCHIAVLDDFGPEADMRTLSSFSDATPKRDKHRKWDEVIVPLGLASTGPGFSEYRSG